MAVASVTSLSAVEQAVRTASQSTGVDFGFLMRTARRESGLDALARSSASSAAGLFQFVEQTWLSTLKQHGAAHGYARYAELIQLGPDGKYHVPAGEEARREIMDLRLDPHCAAIMAGELASDHAAYLRGRVGREPTGGELYAAHFLGPQGSARLIEAASATPSVSAAALFPEAAQANHAVFFHDGRALTAGELYAKLSRTSPTAPSSELEIEQDPGQGAFVTYATAGRAERRREQAEMLQLLLTGEGSTSASPASSLFSADLLHVFAEASKAE